jgi:ligand-binding sensor domain-containing protein
VAGTLRRKCKLETLEHQEGKITLIKMALNSIILFSILTAFTSCYGQDRKTSANKSQQTEISGGAVSETVKNVRFILQDNQSNFWFASDGEGLFRFNGETISRFTEKDGLCGNFVRLIQQDKDGAVFISTSNGICVFDGKQFSKLQPADNKFNTTNLSDLILLFGDYYQGKSLKQLHIPQTSRLTKSYSQTPYAVYCSYQDSKNNIWIGTESRGVCKYDGKTFTWLDNEELGLAVRSIFEDKDGNIWIGNNGNGLFRYDGKTLTNITREHKLENPDFQNSMKGKEGTLARVWTITDDKNGDLWIGTIDAGLWKYDGKTLTNYTIKDGLTSNSISTVFCDNSGGLWIGADNGITKYDGKAFSAFRR